MGNRYNHRRHQNIHRTAFLPMLCSTTSIMDTTINPKHARSSSSSSSSSTDDPLSPKVGCMGQVKRNSHNRVSGFPISSIARNYYNHNSDSYLKLKKLNLITISPNTTLISTVKRFNYRTAAMDEMIIDVAELDPPLPVIKKVQKQDDNCATEDLNLWRRRKSGASVELRSLKIQITNNQCLQQTLV